MSLIGDQIIEHWPWSEQDAAALLTLRVAQGTASRELNALANELKSLRRPGGVTHDRINAVLGIVPMTIEDARQVIRAVLDLRHEPAPPASPFRDRCQPEDGWCRVNARELPAGAIVASESRVWIKRSNEADHPKGSPFYEERWIEATTYAVPLAHWEVDEMLRMKTVEILRPRPVDDCPRGCGAEDPPGPETGPRSSEGAGH